MRRALFALLLIGCGDSGVMSPADLSAAPFTCGDGRLDGDESDVDCGGSCTPCMNGDLCTKDGDCASGRCQNRVCLAQGDLAAPIFDLASVPDLYGVPRFRFGTINIHDTIPGVMAVADFNNDGHPDFISGANGGVVIYLNQSGLFTGVSSFTLGGVPAIADFNGDGKLDLAGAGQPIVLAYGNGDGTFQAPVAQSFDADDLVTADFDGDSKPDLALCHRPWYSDASVEWISNDLQGSGTFKEGGSVPLFDPDAGTAMTARPNCLPMIAGDWNGDSRPDIIGSKSPEGLTLLLQTLSPTRSFAVSDIATGDGTTALLRGDFDGDGISDLAFTWAAATNGVGVLLGSGAGGFKGLKKSASPFTYWIDAGDFDRDGKLDLVAVDHGGGSTTIQILPGRGDGTFDAGQPFVVGADPDGVVVTDVDGDGKADIIASAYTAQQIVVMRNLAP